MAQKALMLLFIILLLAPGSSRAAQLTDQAISDAVQDEIKADRAVPVDRIDIKTADGVVTLEGTVDNILSRDRAARLAQTVKGVLGIRNNIKVDPPDGIADKEIANRVKSALTVNPATDSYKTGVSVSKGVVTLSGAVNSFQERQLAEKVAKGIAGVRDVRNNIRIDYKAPRSDAEIEADIEKAFRWDALLYDTGIDIEVSDGAVKLTGNVASAAEKSRAQSEAYVPGVKTIDASGLQVYGWDLRETMAGSKTATKTDRDIRKAIERKMVLDPHVNSVSVAADVSDGVVTLRGSVESLQAKRAAAEAARTVAGVDRVKNRLKIVPPASFTDARIKDRIAGALSADPYIYRSNVKVNVDNGTAVLSGTVDTYFDKLQAETVTAGIAGVTEIKNNLEIEDPGSIIAYDPYVYDYYFYDLDWYDYKPVLSMKPDSEISKNIGDEMFWSPFVDAEQVKVAVRSGVATLTGTVDSWAESQAATENALEGGATAVVNNLQIAG